MEKNKKQTEKTKPKQVRIPIVSTVTEKARLIELVINPETGALTFMTFAEGKVENQATVPIDDKKCFVPLSSAALLSRHDVVRFPSDATEYESTSQLISEIRSYIHKYVDLDEAFERLAAHFVLFTWVYDRFKEVPYLRRRGDYGTGKTRFLLVVGSICYKPIFVGGASTVSPMFHLTDRYQGTLLIDEADYRFSDQSAEITKILNNGNVKGLSVLRSETLNGKDYQPRAFRVFGPKIITMRGRYDDPALESRFLTGTSSGSVRKDIPLNLPSEQEGEALELRNKLLMYRFRNYERFGAPEPVDESALEPRLKQILAPLLSVAEAKKDRNAIIKFAKGVQKSISEARGQSLEAEVLTVIRMLLSEQDGAGISIKAIAQKHGRAFGNESFRGMAPRALGQFIRTKLNLSTKKSHGVYVVPRSEGVALARLYKRFGVTKEDAERLRDTLIEPSEQSRVDFGDVGDVPTVR